MVITEEWQTAHAAASAGGTPWPVRSREAAGRRRGGTAGLRGVRESRRPARAYHRFDDTSAARALRERGPAS
ncbi:hypothetical protein GCM10010358_75960 [Streptomyces minutiscleroticus]|uniref:Uncharacterized protein n=1 Tax=Streptomyces minutiscleroticus TaxID=68238 RepID=A0A918P0X5_9ACTN|nr:hypothetical protein [Streptomyces minutiscleroticus]GGY12369.1 hypothetical protein GCM10010358_75960 [Streptomyces minutiscleroticus]